MTPGAESRPMVSVAMATYNGARFIGEQLDSIAAQSSLPDELVVSDDGSTDDTLAIVRAFAGTAPFAVRILDKTERLGFADNFLFAAAQCQGEIIAFCDQDDVWLLDKLEVSVGRLLTDDSLLAMHQLTLTDDKLHPIGLRDQGMVRDGVHPPLSLNPWSGWGNSMVFRRELVPLVPRSGRPIHPEVDQPLPHDASIFILAAALGNISFIARPLLLYRQHDSNVFGGGPGTLRDRVRSIILVPITSYRGRERYFGDLARFFDDLARTSERDVRHWASAAAIRYREREERAAARVRLHTDRNIGVRAAAFTELHGRTGSDRASLRERGRSALKDFVLGVTGAGRHV